MLDAAGKIKWLEAWYLHGKWTLARKWVHSQNWDEEDALFAKEHPQAAKVLMRRGWRDGGPVLG